MMGAVPGMPSAAMTTDEARDYLVTFMEQHFTDTTFHRYILATLAGDFAWQMATALRKLATPAPVQQAQDERRERHGLHIAKAALRYGWDESAPEGAFEFITRKAYKTGWDDCKERGHAPVQQAAPSGRVAQLEEALKFYADGEHFTMHDASAWDTVSGEPGNFQEDEANTATVEDGTVARMALGAAPAQPVGLSDEQTHALEAVYESWDGCMYEGAGAETLDIGRCLRQQLAAILAAKDAP